MNRELLTARSNLYALLSRLLLQELDASLLQTLRSDTSMLEFFPNLSTWEPFNRLKISELLDTHFNPDFSNLSLLHLIPYESFYMRDDQMVETGGANPVTDMYSQYDFVVDYDVARVVSADHIGVELEFMHHLVEAQAKAQESDDAQAVTALIEAQHTFLNKHLLQWAPHYLIAAKYEASTPLYHDACDMALEFLLSDNETLTSATIA
ncbi:MAG: dehydrogenase [Sulfuricurvum sp. PC08-66]|nr:MAG: dehydrogenase [Sulfuricurvum sp. PC08-66]